jgi:hypothetical protein
MSEPLDELYFRWLGRLVADPDVVNPYATHWRLLKLLYEKEFVWSVYKDGNRGEDGKDLRYEFIHSTGLRHVDQGWMTLGCSMLEMLIALSRKIAFNAEGLPRGWFWQMLDNAGLNGFNDRKRYSDEDVDDILERIIWRTYEYSGDGGLFPLKCAGDDQRRVELWYQMNAYINEIYLY